MTKTNNVAPITIDFFILALPCVVACGSTLPPRRLHAASMLAIARRRALFTFAQRTGNIERAKEAGNDWLGNNFR
jgi:hypothetical protein